MHVTTYEQFVELVERTQILPFSGFIPEYPSLTAATTDNSWHTGLETDPWTWRIRIASDGAAAYGKFFGDKATFVHIDRFAEVKALLSSNRTVDERYQDGLLSNTALRLYKLLLSEGDVDSRKLRKLAGLDAKEDKREYEKSLVELQNFGDVVITGAEEGEHSSGWSSMCYEPADAWLAGKAAASASPPSEPGTSLREELAGRCSDRAYRYFAKKFRWQ